MNILKKGTVHLVTFFGLLDLISLQNGAGACWCVRAAAAAAAATAAAAAAAAAVDAAAAAAAAAVVDYFVFYAIVSIKFNCFVLKAF